MQGKYSGNNLYIIEVSGRNVHAPIFVVDALSSLESPSSKIVHDLCQIKCTFGELDHHYTDK